ncbi:hypothetical protein QJS10_CPB15g00639 [Acorus calamus]|uniref:RNase H type-1 domain-containing protein n=1 Tax=Acorus calamus TaxID=4465 RepID=A0AAV9D606_ACOCL|nr:hypothetical protein QJS10_CPB15g00639 [Acorus calamus]
MSGGDIKQLIPMRWQQSGRKYGVKNPSSDEGEATTCVLEGIVVQSLRELINILELKGILEGIKLAARRHSSRLWIEGDSQTAICWINGRGSPPWQAIKTLAAIKHLLPLFLEWKASHIRRETNCPADLLASWRKQDGEECPAARQLWSIIASILNIRCNFQSVEELYMGAAKDVVRDDKKQGYHLFAHASGCMDNERLRKGLGLQHHGCEEGGYDGRGHSHQEVMKARGECMIG